MRIPIVKKGDKLTCSICGKSFIAGDDTCYIRKGAFVCSWKCFTFDVKRPKERNQNVDELAELFSPKTKTKDTTQEEPVKKRGRKKKEPEPVVDEPIIVKKKRGRPPKAKQ